MGTTHKIRWWVVPLIICSFTLAPGQVSATVDRSGDEIMGYIFIGEVAFLVTGLTFAAENLHSVVHKERGSAFWRYGAWIMGGLNIAGGVAWLVLNDYKWGDPYLLLGVTHFGLAAMDIGFAIWASKQPERPEQKVTLAPIIIPDAQGRPAVGVGLRLVDW